MRRNIETTGVQECVEEPATHGSPATPVTVANFRVLRKKYFLIETAPAPHAVGCKVRT